MTNPVHIEEHPLFPSRLRAEPQDHDCSVPGQCLQVTTEWLTDQSRPLPPMCICPAIAAVLHPWRKQLPPEDREQHLSLLATAVANTSGDSASTLRRHLTAVSTLTGYHIPLWLDAAGLDLQAHRVRTNATSPDEPPKPSQVALLLELLSDVDEDIDRFLDKTPYHQLNYPAAASRAVHEAGTPFLALEPPGTERYWPSRNLLANIATSLTKDAATLIPYERQGALLQATVGKLQQDTLSAIRRMATLGQQTVLPL